MNKPLNGVRRGWSNHYNLFATDKRRAVTKSLVVQKLIDGQWVTTARAHDVDSARRHAEAVGGCVRALDATTNELVFEYDEDLEPVDFS